MQIKTGETDVFFLEKPENGSPLTGCRNRTGRLISVDRQFFKEHAFFARRPE